MKGIKQLFVIAGLVSAFVIAGCGGGDNNTAVIDNYVGDVSGAIETQNLSKVSNLISESYLNNCFIKDDIIVDYADIFDSPDLESIDVETLEIGDRFVDDFNGVASFFWRSQWTVYYTDDTHETLTSSGTVYLVHESGGWREYGNQLCISSQGKLGTPLGTLRPNKTK